jgi:hypothetical protein
MTLSDEQLREGSAAADGAVPESNAEARAQARISLTRSDSVAFQAVTQSARFLFRGGVSALAAADRAGSLPDAQPKTLRQARAWHHRCAGHYEAAAVRWPRLVWGYVHMTIVKPALNFAEWVTESPVRSAVAVVILTAIWFGR